ncbi:MAG: hypothetical protein PHS82_16645 [Lachnospiraceae bacterium]|nr:hypothetical protein [Lachnospiraceae bacterium]
MKKQKKITAICIMMIMCWNVNVVFAQTEVLSLPVNDLETAVQPENAEVLISDMVEHWNDVPLESGQGRATFAQEDIDLSKAVKVYDDVDVEKAGYSWTLPVYVGDDTVEFGIEEKDNHVWSISSVSAYENQHVDYQDRLKTTLQSLGIDGENCRYALVVGVQPFRSFTAIGFESEKARYAIPLRATIQDGAAYEGLQYLNPAGAQDQYPVYAYADISHQGGYGLLITVLVVAIGGILLAGGIIIWVRKKIR